MKNLKRTKKLIFLSLLSAVICTSVVCEKTKAKETFISTEKNLDLKSFVRQIYAETYRVYGSYADVKHAIFHEHRGFKGYIGLIKTIESYEGIVAYYGGYLYPGDVYPMPTRLKEKKIKLSPSYPTTKKKVVMFKTYKEYLAIENRIFYDDGEFFGYLNATDAWQKKRLFLGS